ncbi:hypothetical protein BDY19DRAFT_615848 [Irpex rosettiformis]|uniref:Uncharacterized protein n=1 Tax=Irpex rosettiformis TaxID=378272 RepID=A0ACB8TP47_9APHY|nr:hypothetical protein BDY19DRAFT_615848 [Irpex rosettiformis]
MHTASLSSPSRSTPKKRRLDEYCLDSSPSRPIKRAYRGSRSLRGLGSQMTGSQNAVTSSSQSQSCKTTQTLVPDQSQSSSLPPSSSCPDTSALRSDEADTDNIPHVARQTTPSYSRTELPDCGDSLSAMPEVGLEPVQSVTGSPGNTSGASTDHASAIGSQEVDTYINVGVFFELTSPTVTSGCALARVSATGRCTRT